MFMNRQLNYTRIFPNGDTVSYAGESWFSYDKNGKLHSVIGLAVKHKNIEWYRLHGETFVNEEQWFDALTTEEKRNYLWR